MTHTTDLPRPTIAGRARVLATRAKYAAGRAIFRHRYEYETDAAMREVRARLFGDPELIAAAADPQTFYAPETSPDSYGHEWSEGDARYIATLAHTLRRAPKETRKAFKNTTRHAADAIKTQREHYYHSTYTRNAALDIANEVQDTDEYRDAIREAAEEGDDAYSVLDTLNYSGAIDERIDSAVPVYTYTILQVFATDSDVDEAPDFAEGETDLTRLAVLAIYAAIQEQTNETLRECIAADIENAADDLADREDALAEVEEYADELTRAAYAANPTDRSADEYHTAI